MSNQSIPSYLRGTFQGGQGSGKSFTSCLLAVGISVEYCGRAPVFVWDAEKDWEFYKQIFAAEKVPLIHYPARSFKSLVESFQEAVSEGACVHVSDQLAIAWRDLLDSSSDDSGYIGMARQNQLRGHWDDFVYQWRELPMHAIACGRIGYEFYDYEEDGHLKFAKGDTKMRAGGAESFGYEGSLECEFTRYQDQAKDSSAPRKRKKILTHVCTVLKDRTRMLNGAQFIFKDFSGYKPGDYKRVFREFAPHLEFLKQVSAVSIPREDSRDLVKTQSWWQTQDRERTALREEWADSFERVAGGMSADAKRTRSIIREAITGLRSDTRIENAPLDQVQVWVSTMMHLEERLKNGDKPATDRDWMTLVEICKKELQGYEAPETLTEVLLQGSIEKAKTMRRQIAKVPPPAEHSEQRAQGD